MGLEQREASATGGGFWPHDTDSIRKVMDYHHNAGGKRVYIISYGLDLLSHLTMETLKALRECDRIYTFAADAQTAGAVSRLAGCPVQSIKSDYAVVADKIFIALKSCRTVGFLTYGNPFFMHHHLPELTRRLSDHAAVRVFPGISSFDMLVNGLWLSSLPACGLRLVDSSSFVREKPILTPEMDTLFFVPWVMKNGCNKWLKVFAKALLSDYPRRSPLYLAAYEAAARRVVMIKGCTRCAMKLLDACTEKYSLLIPAKNNKDILTKIPSFAGPRIAGHCLCRS